MAEDVNEKPGLRPHPGGDPAQEPWVVAHVFEHFHGEDSVESLVRRETVHVGRNDRDMIQAPLAASP